jgi:hypothetical protein
MKIARLFPVFSAAFAAIYALTFYYNWTLFTYQPATMEWNWGAVTKQGPPMFWYGSLVICFAGASAVAALAALVPERVAQRVWPGLTWLVPVAVLAFIAYNLRPYFTH